MPDSVERVGDEKGGLDDMTSPTMESGDTFSPVQRYFLQRLTRMVRLRREQSAELNEDGVHLLDRAIYSTYCDAVDLAVTEQAQEILQRVGAPTTNPPGQK
jgi:hypothetical protein